VHSTTAFPVREIERGDASVSAALAGVWPDAIPALYVQGDWPLDQRAITIVGTTTPAPAARQWAHRFAGEAAARGWIVVSGLALGIDGAAHQGALDAGGRTVAVVADGADALFPVEHRTLARRILREGGSIVSVSPPGTHGGRSGLLLRNQITSALSQIVITAQSRAWDGAMATLRHGFRQGKLIAALVPLEGTDHIRWRGNDLLLRKRSPWRDCERQWVPALPIWPDENFETFFEKVEQALEDGSDIRYPPRASGETQIRLLESIAPYELPENIGS
jgi:DNA processing protein